jgi:hypothetical protein
MFASGSLLIISEATRLYSNVAFRTKLVLLVLAGLNVFVFHNTVFRRVASWDEAAETPVQVKIAGAISISVWFGMMTAGRLIGYTLN